MLPQDLLNDRITIEKAEKIQIEYSTLLRGQESKLNIIELNDFSKLNTVAGVDISYFKKDELEFGVACAVVWDLKKGEIIDREFVMGAVNFPYISGFLGFRESKLLTEVLFKLKSKNKTPDIVMCDGHGIIHPRRFGEAVHLGLTTNIPTFGVAKNPYIGNFDLSKLGMNKGDKVPIISDPLDLEQASNSEVLGYAIRLNNNAKPVYISKGFRITLDLAIKISLESTLDHRQPEPLYLADKYSREKIKELKK